MKCTKIGIRPTFFEHGYFYGDKKSVINEIGNIGMVGVEFNQKWILNNLMCEQSGRTNKASIITE